MQASCPSSCPSSHHGFHMRLLHRAIWGWRDGSWLGRCTALLAAWFEMVGFNRHNEMPLGELLDATIESSPASPVGSSNKGLAVNARRELVSTKRVDAGGWRASGIGDLTIPERRLSYREALENKYREYQHQKRASMVGPLRKFYGQ